jgi:hypothetical protein
MLNLNNKRIIQTRDVFWIENGYNDWRKNKSLLNDKDKDDDIGYSIEDYVALNPKESIIEKAQVIQKEYHKIMNKVYRKSKRLESSFNLDETRAVHDLEQGSDISLDQVRILLVSEAQVELTNFEQDWNQNDPKDQEKCIMAVKKESLT